ncbi:MAG TPA: acyl-CoA dehydrogenase [Nevskiaceae bacterium]|nr:acyl-CoA dehydrogenase [Nevskiaceae bacterium]
MTLFEESLRRFSREHPAAAQTASGTGDAGDHSPQRWDAIAAMGWFDLLTLDPGASGAPPLAPIAAVLRAAGEGAWREPVGAVLGEGAVIVVHAEDAACRASLRDGLVSGAHPVAVAAREPGDGWRRVEIRAKARRRGAMHELDGTKIAVGGAQVAAYFAVLAMDEAGSAWFLVSRDAPGLALDRYAGADGRPLADLRLAATPAIRLCGGEVTPRVEAWGSILAAAESLGIMRGANGDTTDYLRQRKQFGRPLLSFQVLQHRLVEMHMLERETEALFHATVAAHDADSPDLARRVLVLRAQASHALRHVTREAVQMHGGMGVTAELRIGHYYRRALALDSLYGAADWALEALAAA